MESNILKEIQEIFKPSNKAAWEKQAEKDLKGTPLSDLNWMINADLDQFAYATEQDVSDFDAAVLINYNPDWQIAARYKDGDNKKILSDLQNGLTAPVVSIDKNIDFSVLYKDVLPAYIFNHFEAKSDYKTIFEKWKAYTNNDQTIPSFFHFNALFFSSALQKEWQEIVLNNQNENTRTICINAQEEYAGKENITNELKATLNKTKECLAYFKAVGLDEDAFHKQVFFKFYVDKSYLLSIAKLRAFKLAYTQIFNVENLPFVLVEFAPNAYGDDAHDNLINATTMAMSAVLGGANCLMVKPTQENEDGKRLARNVQLILKHESGLHLVSDPANGSYYIESLTKKILENII